MKSMVKAVLLAGLTGVLVSFTVLATPIDVSITGSAPVHQWPGGIGVYDQDFQDMDYVGSFFEAGNPDNGLSPINITGANSIQVTWNAPAGYMYVVNPPPAAFQNNSLQFSMWVQFGQAGDAASLGSVISQSVSMNLVYGNPALFGGVTLENSPILAGADPAITADLNTIMGTGSSPFAFTSATVDATFSGTGLAPLLSPNADSDTPAAFFAVLFGLQNFGQLYPLSDPGPLFTLEPLPTEGSVPDSGSTLTLAGISFLGLVICRRKFLTSEKAA